MRILDKRREALVERELLERLMTPISMRRWREGWISPIPRAERRSCRPCHMSRNAPGVIRRPSPAPPT